MLNYRYDEMKSQLLFFIEKMDGIDKVDKTIIETITRSESLKGIIDDLNKILSKMIKFEKGNVMESLVVCLANGKVSLEKKVFTGIGASEYQPVYKFQTLKELSDFYTNLGIARDQLIEKEEQEKLQHLSKKKDRLQQLLKEVEDLKKEIDDK